MEDLAAAVGAAVEEAVAGTKRVVSPKTHFPRTVTESAGRSDATAGQPVAPPEGKSAFIGCVTTVKSRPRGFHDVLYPRSLSKKGSGGSGESFMSSMV